jgi:hypothetical protein
MSSIYPILKRKKVPLSQIFSQPSSAFLSIQMPDKEQASMLSFNQFLSDLRMSRLKPIQLLAILSLTKSTPVLFVRTIYNLNKKVVNSMRVAIGFTNTV